MRRVKGPATRLLFSISRRYFSRPTLTFFRGLATFNWFYRISYSQFVSGTSSKTGTINGRHKRAFFRRVFCGQLIGRLDLQSEY